MADANRDDNRIPVGLAVEDGSTTLARLKVDPTTRRLLVDIGTLSATGSAHSQPLKRDDNRVPVAGGANDDTTRTIRPLHVESSTGRLIVDLG